MAMHEGWARRFHGALCVGFLGLLAVGWALVERQLQWRSGLFLLAGSVALATLLIYLGRQCLSASRLREQIRSLEREMQDLRPLAGLGENVARVAHDWKSTVHGLKGFLSLLESQAPGGGGAAEVLAGLRRSIDRLEEQARIALSPASARSESQATLLPGTEAAELMDSVTREVSRSFPGIQCLKLYERELPPVSLPPAVLREVLRIVLLNAAEAMKGRGTITLETHTLSRLFQIRVRDHGLGLSEADLKMLFNPGYTTKPGGSGFGLFLARRLLQSAGGSMVAEPAEGGGASFLITLQAGSEPGREPAGNPGR
jgi:signal transduction histidine kinase